MSVYKVPQNVEADDKLLGPFSPRQVLYLGVVAALGGLMWFFFSINLPFLIIIPLPFLILFALLALPIRKDQPMEVWLAALVSFNLKPNKRVWQPDGKEHLIEISAPRNPEPRRTKGIRRDEAARRLSYLSDIVDTEGWAIKNAVSSDAGNDINPIDLEEDALARNIDNMLNNRNTARQNEISENINNARNMADYSRMDAEQIQERMYAVNPMNLYAAQSRRGFSNETPARPVSDEILQATGYQQPPSAQTQPAPQPQMPNSNIAQPAQIPQPQTFEIQPAQIPQQQYAQYSTAQNFETTIQAQPTTQASFNQQASVSYPQVQQSTTQNFKTGQNSTQSFPQFPQGYPQPIEPLSPAEKVKQEMLRQKMEQIVENGKDLSVEQLAEQAHQAEKEMNLSEEEVVISLR